MCPVAADGNLATNMTSKLDWVDGDTVQYIEECFLALKGDQALARQIAGGRLCSLVQNLEDRGCEIGPHTAAKSIALMAKFSVVGPTITFFERFVGKHGYGHYPVLTAMASFYADRGDKERARDLLRRMQSHGVPASIHIFHITLRLLAIDRNEVAAFRAINTLAQTSIAPVRITVHLLLACCRSSATAKTVIQSISDGKWGKDITVDESIYTSGVYFFRCKPRNGL